MSNPITKVDDKSYEKARMKKDDKKTRVRKHKGIKVGEGRGGGGRVKGAKGANPTITVGNFFIQLQYVIPQLTSLASPPALQSYGIRKLEEKRNNNSSNNKRKE